MQHTSKEKAYSKVKTTAEWKEDKYIYTRVHSGLHEVRALRITSSTRNEQAHGVSTNG